MLCPDVLAEGDLVTVGVVYVEVKKCVEVQASNRFCQVVFPRSEAEQVSRLLVWQELHHKAD